jgi:hypothetical protein
MKTLLIIIMSVMLAASALGYTVVDYDDIDYGGGKSVLLTYGWRNSTTADGLSYCTAASGYLYCADLGGFGRGVHHLFNQVSTNYCLSKNNSINGGAANISQRFIFQLENAPLPNLIQQVGLSSLYTSTPPSDMRVYIYMNSSGNTKICLRTGASEVCPYNAPANTNIHDVQVDYVMQNNTAGAAQFKNATIWVDGNSSSISATPTTSFACLNASIYYFRTGLDIYNLTIIHYNETDDFLAWNESIVSTNITYECSDSIDNDADGFIDLLDPKCSGLLDDSEAPVDYAQCGDSEDNDGDNLIDLEDPECNGNLSYYDESPKNTYQCNDNADNDGDGLVDYPTDPSCANYSDNSESPVDASTQPEDSCSTADNCVFKETFPYTDSVYFHDWTELDPLSGYALNVPFMTGRAMQLVNFIPYNLNTTKDFANNPTLYSIVDGTISMFFPTIAEDASFYVVFDNPTAISFKIKVAINNSAQTVSFYSVDEYNNEYHAYTQYKALSVGSHIPLSLSINNAFGTYTLSDGITEYSYNMWYNLSYTRIRFEASGAQMDGDTNLIYVTDHLQRTATKLNLHAIPAALLPERTVHKRADG